MATFGSGTVAPASIIADWEDKFSCSNLEFVDRSTCGLSLETNVLGKVRGSLVKGAVLMLTEIVSTVAFCPNVSPAPERRRIAARLNLSQNPYLRSSKDWMI